MNTLKQCSNPTVGLYLIWVPVALSLTVGTVHTDYPSFLLPLVALLGLFSGPAGATFGRRRIGRPANGWFMVAAQEFRIIERIQKGRERRKRALSLFPFWLWFSLLPSLSFPSELLTNAIHFNNRWGQIRTGPMLLLHLRTNAAFGIWYTVYVP